MSETNNGGWADDGRLVEEELDEWWPETEPADQVWVDHAESVILRDAAELAAQPDGPDGPGRPAAGWDPTVAAKTISAALQVRIEEGQRLWCYDPQWGHHCGDGFGRVTALIRRATRWLVDHWEPASSKKDIPRRYSKGMAGEVAHILEMEHPSRRNPAEPADEMLLGFRNGVLDLRAAARDGLPPPDRLLAHHPDLGLTRCLPWNYNPGGPAPKFAALIADLIPDQAERRLFQQACGSAISELPPPQQMVVLLGKGGEGKSQATDILARIIGDRYVVHLSPQDLGESMFQKRQLRGKAANLPNDLSHLAAKDIAPFKEALGGTKMTCQVKRSNTPEEFRNRATWIATTNQMPDPGLDRTWGFFRRWLPIRVAAPSWETEIVEYAEKVVGEWGGNRRGDRLVSGRPVGFHRRRVFATPPAIGDPGVGRLAADRRHRPPIRRPAFG